MRTKPLLVASAVLALLFGLGLTLAPDAMMSQFGLTPDAAGRVLSRDLGVVLVAVGVMDWLARNAQPGPALSAILWANLLVQGLETVVDTIHIATKQIAVAGVGGVALHVILGALFAWALAAQRKHAPSNAAGV